MFLYVLLLKCYNENCTNFRPIFCAFFCQYAKFTKMGGDFLGFVVQNCQLGCVAHTVRHPKIIFQFKYLNINLQFISRLYHINNPFVNPFIQKNIRVNDNPYIYNSNSSKAI